MKLLAPATMTPAMLLATTLQEADYPAWSGTTTYALGARVLLTSTHRMYESLQASNLNHNPADPAQAAWWVDIGATNPYRVMDGGIGSRSSGPSPVCFVLQPGLVDSLAGVDLDADSARLQVVIGGVTAYDKTVALSAFSGVATWWDYFFQTVTKKTQALFEALPQSAAANLYLTLQSGAAPNLCPDVEAWTLPPGFAVIESAPWNHRAQAGALANGTYIASSPLIACTPGLMYTVSGDSVLLAAGGVDYFDMLFLDAAGVVLLDSGQSILYAPHDYADGQARRNTLSSQAIAPAGAAHIKMRYVVSGATGITAAGFRQPKIEVGGTPPTAYVPYSATPTTITVGAGEALAGKLSSIGAAQYGLGVGIIDYSKTSTDTFGTTSVVKRAFAKRLQFQLEFPTADMDWLASTLANLRATPALWVAADGFDVLSVYGYYKDFSIDIAYPTMSLCSLTIEGLT